MAEKINEKPIDFSLYKTASIVDLILFSIHSINLKKEKCTFGRLQKECFELFPKMFAFSEYPDWPDSRKLDRPLRTLRSQKLIKGTPKTVFTLTKKGKKRALEIREKLKQGKLL